VQGVGYVNELIARLTNASVRDTTSVNHTLDADPATFPLGRAFYADFTHENLCVPAAARRPAARADPARAAWSPCSPRWDCSRPRTR
jgi:hypothetical protein